MKDAVARIFGRFALAWIAAAGIAAIALAGSPGAQAEDFITVASTTSTQDSGLFGYLLPLVKQKTGIEVKVIPPETIDFRFPDEYDSVVVQAEMDNGETYGQTYILTELMKPPFVFLVLQGEKDGELSILGIEAGKVIAAWRQLMQLTNKTHPRTMLAEEAS